MAKGDQHAAAGQALGYVYQVGWALLELCRQGPEATALRLEDVDDVSWHDAAGNPLVALQVKHHQGSAGVIGDKSVDLWRTIKVWLDDTNLLAADGPELLLVTTQTVAAESALSKLGIDSRDTAQALDLLNAAATNSQNDRTAASRKLWLSQAPGVREGIVERIRVVWQQATIEQLAREIRELLGNALPLGREDDFVQRLLGWWWGVSVDLLSGARSGVRRLDLRLELDDLREQYSSRSLPISDHVELPESVAEYAARTFVHQLSLISPDQDLLLLAVRDYYRAYSQAQEWVENNMVELSELKRYENRVVGEWRMQFALMKARLGPNASEADLQSAGLALYSLAMNQSPGLLRSGLKDPFFARGTHHQLADDRRVGWHPDFEQRLQALLATSAT